MTVKTIARAVEPPRTLNLLTGVARALARDGAARLKGGGWAARNVSSAETCELERRGDWAADQSLRRSSVNVSRT